MPIAVLTGSTSGIGRWIARGLAAAGYHLVLPVRDPAKGRALIDWIGAPATIELETADLSSLADTAGLAARIRARHPSVTLLVNNAGVFRARPARTAEGHDLVLAVNHLAPHLLMRELLPALQAGTPARIVTVGSSTSDRARIDPARLDSAAHWRMVGAYAQSKLAVMISTFEIARRSAGTGVVANVVHPGMVATSLIRSGGPIGLAWRAMAPFIRTEAQGAETPLHVALSPDLSATTGRYFKDCAPVAPNRRALDPALAHQVWDRTEALITATRPADAASATSAR